MNPPANNFNDIIDELEWRGSLFDATPGAADVLKTERIKCYNGFDPTSNTLHIGHLLPLIALSRLQHYGHTPIAVLGDGTGMIGDPSGRSEERNLLTTQQIDENAAAIRVQLAQFLDFSAKSNPAQIIRNATWLRPANLLDFLRDIGKHFSVSTMIGKESVRSRMDRDGGISYTEFSYQLLQAYDFLMLYEQEGCTFQSGGSDQWGNIVGGTDLIRRVHGTRPDGGALAHGIVFPLITDANGDKLGKSIGRAPALDPDQFSPYRLYQFFFNSMDADVIRFIRLYTLLTRETILELEHAVEEYPARREAQKRLAQEVTRTVHGESGLSQALRVTNAFFKGNFNDLSEPELLDVFEGSDSTALTKSDIETRAMTYESLAVLTGLAKSLGEVRRTVNQGGMYLNSERVESPDRPLTPDDLLHGRLIVLRRGRREHRLARVM